MRTLALGQAWQDAMLGPVMFVAAELPAALEGRIHEEGFSFRRIAGRPGGSDDLAATLSLASGEHSAVVLDGYHFEIAYQQALREAASALLVLDDEANRSAYDADLLLNPSVHVSASLYPGFDGRLLLGLEHALLRREFRAAKNRKANWSGPPILLVSLGGADHAELTPLIMRSFVAVAPPEWRATVVAGPANPRISELRRTADALGVELVSNVSDMASLMAQAAAAFIAAGSTVLETLLMAVPTCCVAVASNQEALATELGRRGAVLNLGRAESVGLDDLRMHLQQLLTNTGLRDQLAEAADGLVDGLGAPRVARALADASA